jgi:hypothetical protein
LTCAWTPSRANTSSPALAGEQLYDGPRATSAEDVCAYGYDRLNGRVAGEMVEQVHVTNAGGFSQSREAAAYGCYLEVERDNAVGRPVFYKLYYAVVWHPVRHTPRASTGEVSVDRVEVSDPVAFLNLTIRKTRTAGGSPLVFVSFLRDHAVTRTYRAAPPSPTSTNGAQKAGCAS